jgi:hypothetical protein
MHVEQKSGTSIPHNRKIQHQDIYQERHVRKIKQTTPKTSHRGWGDCGNRLPQELMHELKILP